MSNNAISIPHLQRNTMAVFTIWQREIIRYVRVKSRIFSTLFQPLMFLVVFGLGLRRTLAMGNFGIDYVKFMFPGIVAMSVMGVAFFSTISTVWDREFGFLKEILVAPVSRTSIVTGKLLGATSIASTQALLLLILSPLVHISIRLSMIPSIIGLMLLLAFAISGIGLLIASMMSSTEGFGVIMQVLVFPMFFLSGAFFPLTNVPKWMEILAEINPLTYGVDSLRQILLHPATNPNVQASIALFPVPIDVLFLLGFSVVMVSAAVVAFNLRD